MTQEERIKLRDKLFEQLLACGAITTHKNFYQLRRERLEKALRADAMLKCQYDIYRAEFESFEEARYCIIHRDDPDKHICVVCGKRCPFYAQGNNAHYNASVCSHQCAKKRVNTAEAQRKTRATNMRKFGVENAMQSAEIRNKGVATNIQRYGTANPMQSKEIYAKACDTNVRRYGHKNAMQCDEFKAKARKTWEKNHVSIAPITENEVLQLMDVQNVCLSDIWGDNALFEKLVKALYAKNGTFLRLNDLSRIFGFGGQAIKRHVEKFKLLKYFDIQDSKLELQIDTLLHENGISHTRHARSILMNEDTNTHMEIDVLVGDIGIEIDELRSHNITRKGVDYHLNKTIQARENGIRLIHLWEWELTDARMWERISRWLLNEFIEKKDTINPSECEIHQVAPEEEARFIEQYSVCDYMQSEICYGHYMNNELMQLMSFRALSDNCWALQYVCTRYGYTLDARGLLERFVDDYNPRSIVAHCDIAKDNGTLYEVLGFELKERMPPRVLQYINQCVECNPSHPIASRAVYDCGSEVFELDCRR